jgi:hypothetical protein
MNDAIGDDNADLVKVSPVIGGNRRNGCFDPVDFEAFTLKYSRIKLRRKKLGDCACSEANKTLNAYLKTNNAPQKFGYNQP